ncbi:MAG: MBL fold metallo-hydrolase [Bacteroidales bacterium]|jgi:phosphoribosyl 1,2-cyclic phosphate phosphodiesterase|nr:MBL fold metallo-hydrolase [Bacteroidales bacterium]MDD3724561.1 MBL fold metallo-hydrolase [Bacteroidales bacterium]MDD4544561.1 MBL fold metallo-hydrolase [Bacteroidales bacterium]MDY0053987.1 MBL fold metallo-hydrolase [Bacteroidales bacterium]
MGNLKLCFLGTGTSQGVPVIGCNCEVCSSNDIRDKRLRTSCIITSDQGTQILIDSGPDFREQMLRHKVSYLDAILITHSHRDHIGGLDDVRSYNYLQSKAMPIYSNAHTLRELKTTYSYAFQDMKYPGLPAFDLKEVNKNQSFSINELEIIPIEVIHYKLPILGYRIGNITYITDAKTISNTEIKKIIGTEILIVNALREEEHFSHFTLSEALDLVEIVKPKKAYFIHISHSMLHSRIQAKLPGNVFLAYDDLEISSNF